MCEHTKREASCTLQRLGAVACELISKAGGFVRIVSYLKEKERGREKEIIHPLVLSPNESQQPGLDQVKAWVGEGKVAKHTETGTGTWMCEPIPPEAWLIFRPSFWKDSNVTDIQRESKCLHGPGQSSDATRRGDVSHHHLQSHHHGAGRRLAAQKGRAKGSNGGPPHLGTQRTRHHLARPL